jgi:hypothetical protein
LCSTKKSTFNLKIDGGYFMQHKPENPSGKLGDFFYQIETGQEQLNGKKITQSEYDIQVLILLIKAIEAGYKDELVNKLRRIFNKGALERILEKTDLEEALVELIGDIEIDLIEKFREFIRMRIEMRIAQLSESELGQKLEDLKDKIDNLPPYIKEKIENLVLKILENSSHLPESIKEKIKEYSDHLAQEKENNSSSYWDTLGSYATAPFSYAASYITETIWPRSKLE